MLIRVNLFSFSRGGYGYRRAVKRRFGGRRKYGYKKRGMSVKKRIVGSSARAARDGRTNTPMCRDLGMLWPSCLIMKLRMHATVGVAAATTAWTAGTGGYYFNIGFNFWPYDDGTHGPLRTVPWAAGSTIVPYQNNTVGLSPASTCAGGINRILGASSATASSSTMYAKCCVLSAKYIFTVETVKSAQSAVVTGSAGAARAIDSADYYFHHLAPVSDSALVAATSQQTADQFWVQPDVRRKLVGSPTGLEIINSGTAGTAMVGQKGHKVLWKGTCWPHKLYDMSFTDYVSDQSAYGTTTAFPGRMAALQLAGFTSTALNNSANNDSVVHCNIIFTCLFKEIAATMT